MINIILHSYTHNVIIIFLLLLEHKVQDYGINIKIWKKRFENIMIENLKLTYLKVIIFSLNLFFTTFFRPFPNTCSSRCHVREILIYKINLRILHVQCTV